MYYISHFFTLSIQLMKASLYMLYTFLMFSLDFQLLFFIFLIRILGMSEKRNMNMSSCDLKPVCVKIDY